MRNVDDLIRPSSAERWLNCHAAPIREAAYKATSSEAADEGTAAHQVASAALAQRLPVKHFAGQVVNGFEVTGEMVDAVQSYIDHVLALNASWRFPTLIEHEVPLSFMPNNGTLDAAVLEPAAMHVIDFKYGRGVVVNATNNAQLMTYAQGMLDHWENLLPDDLTDVPIYLHIVQPRARSKPDTWRVDWQDLMCHETRIVRAIKAIRGPTPAYAPGAHCRFCAARRDCEALQGFALRTVQEPPSADLRALGDQLRAVETVQIWAKAIKDAALSTALEGAPPYGFKLVKGDGHRAWRDSAEAVKHAKRKRLHVDTYAPREPASVAQLEKALGKKEFVRLGFPALTHRPEGAATLVPDTDGRDAINPQADLFAELNAASDEFDPLA